MHSASVVSEGFPARIAVGIHKPFARFAQERRYECKLTPANPCDTAPAAEFARAMIRGNVFDVRTPEGISYVVDRVE
jgi:hypothetical protein